MWIGGGILQIPGEGIGAIRCGTNCESLGNACVVEGQRARVLCFAVDVEDYLVRRTVIGDIDEPCFTVGEVEIRVEPDRVGPSPNTI